MEGAELGVAALEAELGGVLALSAYHAVGNGIGVVFVVVIAVVLDVLFFLLKSTVRLVTDHGRLDRLHGRLDPDHIQVRLGVPRGEVVDDLHLPDLFGLFGPDAHDRGLDHVLDRGYLVVPLDLLGLGHARLLALRLLFLQVFLKLSPEPVSP